MAKNDKQSAKPTYAFAKGGWRKGIATRHPDGRVSVQVVRRPKGKGGR